MDLRLKKKTKQTLTEFKFSHVFAYLSDFRYISSARVSSKPPVFRACFSRLMSRESRLAHRSLSNAGGVLSACWYWWVPKSHRYSLTSIGYEITPTKMNQWLTLTCVDQTFLFRFVCITSWVVFLNLYISLSIKLIPLSAQHIPPCLQRETESETLWKPSVKRYSWRCRLSLSVYTVFCYWMKSTFYDSYNVSSNQDVFEGSRPLMQQVSSESRGSIPESLSEFFDAKEYLLSGSSSENEVRS